MDNIIFEKEKSTERIEIRLTKTDKNALKDYANANGKTIAQVIKSMIKNDDAIGRYRHIHLLKSRNRKCTES